MKISKEQKFENHIHIINAATELFVEQGYDKTTMKQIAKKAGIGDATIYKYYPNKEKLITGFYDIRGQQAILTYESLLDEEDYTLEEKLQLLADTLLEQLIADREFVALSLNQFMHSPLMLLKDRFKIGDNYKNCIQAALEQYNQLNPNTPIPLLSLTAGLLTDALFGLIIFWIKDESEDFSHTQQLSNLSIELFSTFIKSGLISKSLDIMSFILKTQLVRLFESNYGILSLVQGLKNQFDYRK